MSKGKCNLCGSTFSKAAMTRHLKSCKQGESVPQTAQPGRSLRKTKTFHLIVEGHYSPDYWIHLEVPANANLEVLDRFLRRIWLECCGHMSAFTIEGKRYSVAPVADFDEESMRAGLSDVLCPDMKFYYEYDFGSTTHLALKVLSQQQSEIKGKSIRLLARNEPPSIPCDSCGKIAAYVCAECVFSDEGCLCDECVAEHECDEEMLLPVVNSPRVGMCGYTG